MTFAPFAVVAGLNVPALDPGVPGAGATLQLTPLGSLVEAATEKLFVVAMAARAIGTLTVTFPVEVEDEDEELEDEELDEDPEEEVDEEVELAVEEEEKDEELDDDLDEEPFDPPPPQAGRIAAHASIPTNIIVPSRCSRLRGVLAGRAAGAAGNAVASPWVVELRLLDRVFSRIQAVSGECAVETRGCRRA